MAFEYSSFFSYRRNSNDIDFIYNLKNIIQTEGMYATNYNVVFFDEKCIELGHEFDDKIYDGIIKSCSFTLIFSPHYINEKNNWCAKELFRAIKFENYIRQKIDNKNFSFIFPLMHRGNTDDLPKSINKKNVKFLHEFSSEIKNASITNHPVTQKFEEFKRMIGDVFVENYKLIQSFNLDWKEIEEKVTIPSEEELQSWIKEQRTILRKNESENPPKLT